VVSELLDEKDDKDMSDFLRIPEENTDLVTIEPAFDCVLRLVMIDVGEIISDGVRSPAALSPFDGEGAVQICNRQRSCLLAPPNRLDSCIVARTRLLCFYET
jgi:hypothetical protein